MKSYRHTQIGWAVIVPLLAVPAVVWAFADPTSGDRAILPWLAGVLLVVLSLFATLTVTVAGGWVRCRFGVGLIGRKIRLRDVRHAEAVRNRWYYGWGIRLTPHGWLWNVSGLSAVELTFASGRKFRLGTDEPDRLLQAIHDGSAHADSSA